MPSLTSMAEAILVRARCIDAYLEAERIAYPSFDEDTLRQLPNELQDERWALANLVNEMKQLTRGAEMRPFDVAFNWTDNLALRVVYRYRLADAVPLTGSVPYKEIAAAAGLRESLCRRFMRLAMGNCLFTEDPVTHRVSHSASSRLLVTDPDLRDAIGLQVDEVAPTSAKLIDVWDEHGQDAMEPSQSAFSMYHGSDEPFFAILSGHAKRAKRFDGTMAFCTKGDAFHLRHLLTAFDWAALDLPGSRVVDVGGGVGTVSKYLAEHTSHIRFIVQDQAHVISQPASGLLPELRERIEYAEHDFFHPQDEVLMPNAFVLRWIFHDWPDHYVVKILSCLVPAMRKETKILIWEFLLEDRPISDLTGRVAHQMDAIMAVVFNASERTPVDFDRLLRLADARYKLVAVRQPKGSSMGMVEVGWSG